MVLTTTFPPMGVTENNSLTYLATGNYCLDFFFHVVPGTPKEELIQRLEIAWEEDPLMTLKLIFNLRGIRGTGKSDKERFFTCALWLHAHHPITLRNNMRHAAEFGCFKDLNEILFRLLEGDNIRKERKQQKLSSSKRASRARSRTYMDPYDGYDSYEQEQIDEEWRRSERKKKKQRHKENKKRREHKNKVSREERVKANLEKQKQDKEKAGKLRKEKLAEKAKRARKKYDQDEKYRLLHDEISKLFAEYLMADMKYMKSGEFRKISLASKWCPSLDSAYDNSILICESIAKRIFPREEYPEYEGLEDGCFVYRVRDRLRKEVLVPLHKVLELPELYIGEGQWGSLPYNRVASVAMKRYKNLFESHDSERFVSYLEDVKKGKAKIAAGALLPHEIISSLEDGVSDVAELQWKRMVDDMKKEGNLRDCVAVCDVSGSMRGTPMEVCVALGLLISELSEEPWKNKVITFTLNPEFHLIQGDDLKTKTQFIKTMSWGYTTDFQKVFDQILKVAVDAKIDKDQMVKRVFVFSDMEFDQASRIPPTYRYDTINGWVMNEEGRGGQGWETDYEVIQRKFKENGYDNVPEIVFWNLRSSRATPVTSSQPGVALLSGFSKNLIKLFFAIDGTITPLKAMELAIAREEYQKLAVYD